MECSLRALYISSTVVKEECHTNCMLSSQCSEFWQLPQGPMLRNTRSQANQVSALLVALMTNEIMIQRSDEDPVPPEDLTRYGQYANGEKFVALPPISSCFLILMRLFIRRKAANIGSLDLFLRTPGPYRDPGF